MNVSNQDARESLEQIQNTIAQTRKAIASSPSSSLLILWGVIWIGAFLGTHFLLRWAWHIWMVLDGVGMVSTFLIFRQRLCSATPTMIPAERRIGWHIFWFWTLLFVYVFVWLSIFAPCSGLQCNALICTAVMFAFVVTGIWSGTYYMVWLGLAVTGMTLVGFYVIPHSYYCLWMAPTAGGALVGTGLYIRFRWR